MDQRPSLSLLLLLLGLSQASGNEIHDDLDHVSITSTILESNNGTNELQYIRINWQYIYDYAVDNFQKQDTNNLNTTYDYSSVMHYDRTAFTNNYGKETITPIPDSSVAIGQRLGMSDIDVLRVNKLYQC